MLSSLTNGTKVHEEIKGMWVAGYMTVTTLRDDSEASSVCYGTFDTIEQAQEWSAKLDNAEIVPVYYPSYNRG